MSPPIQASLNLTGLQWDVCIGRFKSILGVSDVQPTLRTRSPTHIQNIYSRCLTLQVTLKNYSQPCGITWLKHNSFCLEWKRSFGEEYWIFSGICNGISIGTIPSFWKADRNQAVALSFSLSLSLSLSLSFLVHFALSETQIFLPPQLWRKMLWLPKVTTYICALHLKLHLPRGLPFSYGNKMVPMEGHSLTSTPVMLHNSLVPSSSI